MPRVGSRQASLNKLIWCKILCYLLCIHHTTIIGAYWDTKYESRRENEYGQLAAVCLMHVDISSQLASDFVSMYPSRSQKGKKYLFFNWV